MNEETFEPREVFRRPTSAVKRALYTVGHLLSALGLFFIAHGAWRRRADLSAEVLSPPVLAALALTVIGYTASCLLPAMGWRRILEHHSEKVSLASAVYLYGTSQIAKYIPGNIAQFAYRQALGAADGIAGKALAWSVLWELGFLAAAGVMFLPLCAGYIGSFTLYSFTLPSVSLPVAGCVFLILPVTAIIVLYRIKGIAAAQGFVCYFLFVTCGGIVFAAVFHLADVGGITPDTIVPVCSGAVIAWLAGLVTPGSPSGLGVREAVLYFLLRGITDRQAIVPAVLLWRLVTVSGDVLFFLSAKICRKFFKI
jgi:uncharacterized membrane protein YbhN (UPF0104 family)